MKSITNDMSIGEIKEIYCTSKFVATDLSYRLTYGNTSTDEEYYELWELHSERYKLAENILRQEGYKDNGLYSLYDYIVSRNQWNERLLNEETTIREIAMNGVNDK